MQPRQTHTDSDFPGMGALSAGDGQGLPKKAIRSMEGFRVASLQRHLPVTAQDLRGAPPGQTLLGPGKCRAVEPLIRQSGQMIELQGVGRMGWAEENSVLSREPTEDKPITAGEVNARAQAESSGALHELFSERSGGREIAAPKRDGTGT